MVVQIHSLRITPRSLTSEEWAYLAGIIDGEGCISRYLAEGRMVRYRLAIATSSPELGRWLFGLCGSCSVRIPSITGLARPPKHGAKLQYFWQVYAIKDLRMILLCCLPYLKIKKVKAREALRHLETRIELQRRAA